MSSANAPRLTHAVHRPPKWITAWFIFSTLLVIWDVGYLVMRPRSMVGGDLHYLWSPYALYATIDTNVYGLPAWEMRNGWPMAQSFANIMESILNLVYLWLAHVRHDPASVLVAFGTVVATCSKTLLYAYIEAFSGFAGIKHNSMPTLVFLYILPNGPWIVVPGYLIWYFGVEIADALRLAMARRKAD